MTIDVNTKISDLTVAEFMELNKLLKVDDTKTLTITEACEQFNVKRKAIYYRMQVSPEIIKRKGKIIRASIKDWKKLLV